MAELPFLVVHGAVVWKVLLAALVVASFGLLALLRACWVRLVARARTRARVRRVAAIAEGDACVRGHLRGGSLATLAGVQPRNHVEGAPRIECADGTRVELAGAQRVVVGARTATSRLRVPTGTPKAIADRGGRWILRAVGDGDEVVATGKVARIARADASYRDDGTAWRMTAGEVAAMRPTAKLRPAHPAALLAGLVIAVAGWYLALEKTGSSALELVGRRPDRATDREVAPFGDFAIAAAMPGSRDDAFREASESFHWRYHHLGSMMALRDAIDAEIGPCRSASNQLREVRLDAALASARVCGDAELEARIQLYLGNFDKALASPQPTVRERAAIGLGNWKAAADAADALSSPDLYDTRYAQAATASARCRAAWYRNLAGIATTVPTEGDRCTVYAALVQPADRQRELLRVIADTEDHKPVGERDSSYEERVRTLINEPPSDVGFADVADRVSGIAWMALHQPYTSTDIHLARARVAVVRGDFARARIEAAAVDTNHKRRRLEVWIALREGTELPRLSEAELILEPAAELREGKLPTDPDTTNDAYPGICVDDLRRAVATAITGDGGPLAQVFAECKVYYIFIPRLLFGILPRVTQHRSELADALRVFRHDNDTWSNDNVPFTFLEHLAEYRDFARLTGDTAEADRLQAIISRHAQALADRDRTIAFMLLE